MQNVILQFPPGRCPTEVFRSKQNKVETIF